MSRGSILTDALLGRDDARAGIAFSVGIALFLVFFLMSTIGESQRWMEGWFGRFSIFVVLGVLIVGGGIAAGNAYWNDGLVLSWFLVFGPVFGWLWNWFVQEGSVFFHEAIVPVLWAVFTALVVGTIGYVIGRIPHGFPSRDTGTESTGWLLRVLVGKNPMRSARWGLLAGVLFVIAGGLTYVTRPYLSLPVEGVDLVELFFPPGVLAANTLLGVLTIFAWMGLAMWPAYRNAGLFVSCGLVFGPISGALLIDFVVGGLSSSGPLVDATFALLAALILAVILGTGGFILGIGFRRIMIWRGNNRREQDVSV